ncbi:FeoB-associated Cys-rich membrane protein [Tepidibacillus marianensis]|uniref:FeoB-associated Cys-rich membrane protein n=1 Tax=Tepidibacillus marianensis TaxID=3131995 RepID=UPI0030CDF73B
MIITYLIVIFIVGYSAKTLFRSYKNWKAGKSCTNCTGCSLNDACPVQQLKANQAPLILERKA